MKIYFTAAVSKVSDEIRGNYDSVITTLEHMGHTVVASHIRGKNEEIIKEQSEKEALAIQRRLSKWKKQADIVVVEASTPSFGVGQEIAEAIADNRQVLVLHIPGVRPHILKNTGLDSIYIAEYDRHNLEKVLADYLEYAKTRADTRFNFFISPQIGAYLDWVSRKRKIPRAVYLRRLIEKDMEQNEEYKG